MTFILCMTLILWLIVEIIYMAFIKYHLCFVYHITMDASINYGFLLFCFSCLLKGEGLIQKLWKILVCWSLLFIVL